jgi:hypothetical protein
MTSAEMVKTAAATADIGEVYRASAKHEGRKLEADEHAISIAETALALQAYKEWLKGQEPLDRESAKDLKTVNILH